MYYQFLIEENYLQSICDECPVFQAGAEGRVREERVRGGAGPQQPVRLRGPGRGGGSGQATTPPSGSLEQK